MIMGGDGRSRHDADTGCDDRHMSADSFGAADSLTIPYRFRGPKGCGNGGYTAGLLARLLSAGHSGPVEVTLRLPPPLDVPLHVATTTDVPAVRLHTADGGLVAEATRAQPVDEVVEPVPYEAAHQAEAAFGGWARHPFPECFVCGTSRAPDEALCLRPGTIDGERTACTWQPRESIGVDLPVVWAALDCPSGWTADVAGRPIVLGRIRAYVETPPRVGMRCVVTGRRLGEEGRKVHTASTLYDEEGRLLAAARQTWIAVDPTQFGEDA
jgi:hypothetical protein